MIIGLIAAIGLQVATSALLFGIIALTGNEFRARDRGDDVFDQAAYIWEWSDERLKAAVEGAELPDAPAIFADVTSLRIGFATTLVYDVLLVAMVAILTRQADFKELRKTFSLDQFSFGGLWVPVLAVIAMYAMTILYTVIVTALDIEILIPSSSVPAAVTRDDLALAMAGVLACIAAPLAEEIFYRGFFFRGLLQWGFLPAAASSAFIFSGAHLDIGSLIPFFVIGFTMAWLYWRRGRLWDSIVFHFIFNATSFALLASGAGEGG